MNRALFAFIPFMSACVGEPPQNIGVINGRLSGCPESPNCVSSFDNDETHVFPPLQGNLREIEQIIVGMDSANIVEASESYLYAEFTSRLMGYVDDVEFLHDQTSGLTHVRSASRLGYSDLGVNRKRIEAIRTALASN